MKKRTLIIVGTVIVIVLALAGFKYHQITGQLAQLKVITSAQPQPVVVSPVKPSVWHDKLNAIGSLQAIQGISLAAEVGGVISKIHFKSGGFVTKGQPIIDLKSDILEANIKADEADVRLTKLTYERNLAVFKKNGISKEALDTSESNYEKSTAALESDQARLAQKRVVAPFSGQLGIRQVSLGQYLQLGSPIVSLQTINPIYISFSLPEQDLNQLKIGQFITVKSESWPTKSFSAKLTVIDANISDKTKGINLQGTVQNDQKLLKPGMLVTLTLHTGKSNTVIAIPRTAVNYALHGNSVFIISKKNGENIASRVYITTLDQQGDLVSVTGLKPGQQIVTAGQTLLQNGMAVKIVKKLS